MKIVSGQSSQTSYEFSIKHNIPTPEALLSFLLQVNKPPDDSVVPVKDIEAEAKQWIHGYLSRIHPTVH